MAYILLGTHCRLVRDHVDQILEFLERSTDNIFITSRWVMDSLGRSYPPRSEFEERIDGKLLYFGGGTIDDQWQGHLPRGETTPLTTESALRQSKHTMAKHVTTHGSTPAGRDAPAGWHDGCSV